MQELEDAVDAREPLAAQLTERQTVRRDSTTSMEDLIKANIFDSVRVLLLLLLLLLCPLPPPLYVLLCASRSFVYP
jgi:hypothetical protein